MFLFLKWGYYCIRNIYENILIIITNYKKKFATIFDYIPPRSGPPKDPEPPCFNFSAFSELILLNKDRITTQQYPRKIAMTNGTRPMVRRTGNSGSWSANKGSGKMTRITAIETKQQMLIKYIINHGIKSHRVQHVPPAHIMTRRRLDNMEYL